MLEEYEGFIGCEEIDPGFMIGTGAGSGFGEG